VETTRLSSKGQIIIPKSVRDAHGWTSGTEFAVEVTGEGILLRPKPAFEPTSLDAVAGCLEYAGPSLTVDDMARSIDEVLRETWARKFK
jgi:AbrB family looped-hinge helix DNA binding protein